MNDELLFVRTLDDLHKSINSKDEYEVLRASALIRQLFLDGGKSLVDKIIRKYQHKLEFEVIDHTPPDIGIDFLIWAVIDGIDPKSSPPHLPLVRKKRDSFFNMIVAIVDGHRYSISEIVKFVANVMGGVHSGSLKDEKDKNLVKLQEMYIFSDINVALLFIRSIGRIVLESLIPLQYLVLGLNRFEGSSGIAIYLSLVLIPLPDKDNFILDIGTEKARNRLSIFLDFQDNLCLRFHDNNGLRHFIQAGANDCAYRYGEATYLSFQMTHSQGEIMLSIESGGWSHFYIKPSHVSMDIFQKFHYVMGSDIFGTAETNMSLMELCVFSKLLTLEDQNNMKDYLRRRIIEGYKSSVHFQGNQFLNSTNHPNFIN